ncbi:MAG: hypothetical protein ACD_40C00037G0015 [uncultured bacterium]|nr:MAG: hypothetical protein ACD_40C00037G0015 [uncultured bacterium]KKU25760.1 MAG: hypothetical protein UX37_C0013G0005 [Microgenomates group bacterium GW2011_GWA2_46_16]
MKIAVIILHYGLIATTRNCLSKLKEKIGPHQVILINNTQDDLSPLTTIISGTQLINNPTNYGFARGVNQGIALASKDQSITHFFLMNNDLYLSTGNLQQLLLTFAKYSSAGIVSPVLHHSLGYDWGGKYNRWSGMVRHKNWENKPKTTMAVEHVAGAAMLISRKVLQQIHLFDERFFLYFEDLDFCLRAAQAGYTTHINPDVTAEHVVSAGSNALGRTGHQWASHLKFVTKHLFRLTYPTAYLYDLFIYPLWLLRSTLRSTGSDPEGSAQPAAKQGRV